MCILNVNFIFGTVYIYIILSFLVYNDLLVLIIIFNLKRVTEYLKF